MLFNCKRYLALFLLFYSFANAASITINGGGYFTWQSPVDDASMLPVFGNTDGAVKIALDTKGLYSYDALTGNWLLIASPAAATAMTALIGDVHATGPGAAVSTIQPNVVTNAKLAQMAAFTIKGNNTGSTANAADVLMSALPISTDAQTALNLKENSSNKDNGPISTSSITFPTSGAVRTFGLSLVGGLPIGVLPTVGNKFDFRISNLGLLMQSYNMPAATAGAYNGGGTGNKGILGFDNYNTVPFSSLADLSFTAKNIRDEAANPGNVYWNLLGNFNTGATSTATDYVNLSIDGISQHLSVPLKFFKLTTSYAVYDMSPSLLANERMVKAVGGTECVTNLINAGGTAVANMTGTFTSSSPVVTGMNNTSSIIVGQNIADFTNGEYNISQRFPSNTHVLSIDSSTQITMDQNATSSGTEVVCFYGGISPPNRSVIASGTTTLTGVTNTDDLQINQIVTGSGVPSGSYIVSKVRNVSITLNNAVTAGTPTISIIPAGLTGIPANTTNVGITWAKMVSNNPNGYFANTAPTVAGGWAVADGGWPKNSVQSAINLVQGGSSTLDSRINAIKSITINSDTYLFTNQ